MKTKRLWLIPIILIIVSIFSSIIAFQQSRKLEDGYLYVDGDVKTTTYEGEYVAIIGNTGDAYYLSVSLQNDYVELVTYNSSNIILDRYHVIVSKDGVSHDASLISSSMNNDIKAIDEMDAYAFVLNLEKNETYVFDLEVIDNDPFTDDIDLVFAHIPEHTYNLKTLMEGLAFTTLIFTVISTITISVIIMIRKNR